MNAFGSHSKCGQFNNKRTIRVGINIAIVLVMLFAILPVRKVGATPVDVFLQGTYMELGINVDGYFGSTSDAPAGYHPDMNGVGNSGPIGFVADYQKDGWGNGTPPFGGDYFLPGTPYEGFSIKWNNSTTVGNFGGYSSNIPTVSLTDTSSGTTHSAVWVGEDPGIMRVTHTISFEQNDTEVNITTLIENINASSLSSLEFMRTVDPDNEQTWTGSFRTTNQVLSQPTEGNDLAVVVAQGVTYPDMLLGLKTNDSRALVSANNNWSQDPDSVLNSPVLGPVTGDDSIGLTFSLGDLAAGNSVSVTYQYILSESALPPELIPTVTSTTPADLEVLSNGPTSIEVNFSEDMLHDGSGGSANFNGNYLLVGAGDDGIFQTASCAGGVSQFDQQITINSASYSNNGGSGPFVATLGINVGVPLPVGFYRLFVCGSTSIRNLAGTAINLGVDSVISFTVAQLAILPKTGFAQGTFTLLPVQTSVNAYEDMGDLWLEIPDLNVKVPIIEVPALSNGWDTTWLGNNVGYLQGTAFPTWAGNSVLTGHNYNSNGKPGPFANLDQLSFGNKIIIHAWGQEYTYEVRQVLVLSPNSVSSVIKHESYPWLTLVTCKGYDSKSGNYLYRLAVRAIQISIK